MEQSKNIGKLINDIYIYEHLIKDSDQFILLIHGLAEHSGRYSNFISLLNNSNINVVAMDLRGHGNSAGKRGDVESLQVLLNDINNIVEYIFKTYQVNSLGIFGHSFGGLLAVLYQNQFVKKIDYVVLSSPVVYRPKKLNFLKIVPCHLLKNIYIKKTFSESSEMLQYNRQDELALKKFSLRTIGILFKDGIKEIKKINNIEIPLLLTYGNNDILLNEKEKQICFFKKATHIKSQIIGFENAKHRIVNNEGSPERINKIIDWIKNAINNESKSQD